MLVAARLAEDPSSSVAVVEAGSFYELDNGNGSVIPALCTLQDVGTDANITQPLIDWNFVTTPQAVGGESSCYSHVLWTALRMNIGSQQPPNALCSREDVGRLFCT